VGAAEQFWAEVQDLFDADDGSLPEIVLADLGPHETRNLLDHVVGKASAQEDRSSVDTPERILDNLQYDGVRLPTLGIDAFDDELVIDYRMGDGWNAETLAAFARLLGELRDLAPHARIVAIPEGGVEAHADPRFPAALDQYLASSPA
jgi:hypothetical protein